MIFILFFVYFIDEKVRLEVKLWFKVMYLVIGEKKRKLLRFKNLNF